MKASLLGAFALTAAVSATGFFPLPGLLTCTDNPIFIVLEFAPQLSSQAVTFCSSFLHIPTATATATSTGSATATVIQTIISTFSTSTTTTVAAGALGRRKIPTPPCFLGLADAQVSSSCSCLSIPQATSTTSTKTTKTTTTATSMTTTTSTTAILTATAAAPTNPCAPGAYATAPSGGGISLYVVPNYLPGDATVAYSRPSDPMSPFTAAFCCTACANLPSSFGFVYRGQSKAAPCNCVVVTNADGSGQTDIAATCPSGPTVEIDVSLTISDDPNSAVAAGAFGPCGVRSPSGTCC